MLYENIKQIPVLSGKENRELARKAQQGDKQARDKLIKHNLRIIFKAIHSFKGLMEFDDLFDEGVIGLIKAIDYYNPDSKEEFITYAYHAIKNCVMRATDNKSRLIRLPVSECDKARKRHSFDGYVQAILCLDKPIQDGQDDTLINFIKSDTDYEEAEHHILQEELHKALQPLFAHCHPTTIQILLDANNGMRAKQIRQKQGLEHKDIYRTCRYGMHTLRKYADESLKEYIV